MIRNKFIIEENFENETGFQCIDIDHEFPRNENQLYPRVNWS